MNRAIHLTAAEVVLCWLDNGVESDPFPYSAIYEVLKQNGERDQAMRRAYEQGKKDERKRVVKAMRAESVSCVRKARWFDKTSCPGIGLTHREWARMTLAFAKHIERGEHVE